MLYQGKNQTHCNVLHTSQKFYFLILISSNKLSCEHRDDRDIFLNYVFYSFNTFRHIDIEISKSNHVTLWSNFCLYVWIFYSGKTEKIFALDLKLIRQNHTIVEKIRKSHQPMIIILVVVTYASQKLWKKTLFFALNQMFRSVIAHRRY
jgi:hypothetical protein